MARIRTIKPDFFLDDDLCELSPLHRLLFAGLWTLADCEGRLEDKPKKIHIQILPYDKCDVDRMLSDLSAKRSNGHSFIRRYSVDGSGYIQIPNFRKHQRISGKEAQLESGYPPPTEGSIGEAIGKQSGSISAIPESQEGKGRERKGKERSTTCAELCQEYLCAGNPPTWNLSKEKLGEYQALYPNMDCLIECKKAAQWLKDNPGRRKTARGMPRFLLAWLERSQNRGGGEKTGKVFMGKDNGPPQYEGIKEEMLKDDDFPERWRLSNRTLPDMRGDGKD